MCGTRPATSIPCWLELRDLGRVVGEQADPADAELAQHRRRRPEVALVVAEAEVVVGVDRVQAAVLQAVGAQLVGEADAAALLREVEQDAGTLVRHPADGAAQLVAAVAAQRAQEIAGEALRVQPRQGGRLLSGSPTRIANCSGPPSAGRNATIRTSSASASGTRASLTGRSVDADSAGRR